MRPREVVVHVLDGYRCGSNATFRDSLSPIAVERPEPDSVSNFELKFRGLLTIGVITDYIGHRIRALDSLYTR